MSELSEEPPCIGQQVNLRENLKQAVKLHNNGRDPVPYLLSALIDHDEVTQWKILAQICSYTIFFNENLHEGVKYFMLLVDAEQCGVASSNLILVRQSNYFGI